MHYLGSRTAGIYPIPYAIYPTLGDIAWWIAQVHYLGDPDRGSVWEETIINCPRHIQLLAMSATVANPDDLGGWISQARPQGLGL